MTQSATHQGRSIVEYSRSRTRAIAPWMRLVVGGLLLAPIACDRTAQDSATKPSSLTNLDSAEPAGFADCPVYGTPQSTSLAATGVQWSRMANLTEAVFARRPGGAVNGTILPRNNFIDDYIFDRIEADGIPTSPLCSDEEFVRRAYLDLTGRIPTADAVQAFVANLSPSKRADLIDTLLDSGEYVDRMTVFFGDLLENTYSLLWNGRTQYYTTIRNFVLTNQPYNQFVIGLLTSEGYSWEPGNGSVNFLARSWESMANRLDVIDDTIAQVGREFLGMPLLCLSCHSGAGHVDRTNLYLGARRRSDFWGLGAFFGQLNYVRRQEQPNTFSYTFEYDTYQSQTGYNRTGPGSGGGVRPARTPPGIDPPVYFFTGETPLEGANWRAEFARIMTSDRQFARTAVNYLWKMMLGMGIVDPPDAFDLARIDPANPPPDPWTIQPTHPELLERLADEFIATNYDIKAMVRLIANSTTYQLSATFPTSYEVRYGLYFARHFARRMAAEQLLDSVFQATNLNDTMATRDLGDVLWTGQLPDPTEPTGGGVNASIRTFLDHFLRGTRDDRAREVEGSILQALDLLNNTLIVNKIRANGGGLVTTLVNDASLTDNDVVDGLFLATLSRGPTPNERSQALEMLGAGRASGAEDLQLLLINKLDFLFY